MYNIQATVLHEYAQHICTYTHKLFISILYAHCTVLVYVVDVHAHCTQRETKRHLDIQVFLDTRTSA